MVHQNVICLKWGDKYSPDYVNKLYNAVERCLKLPHTFSCITEDDTGLDPDINIIPIPEIGSEGWWYKLTVFDNSYYKFKSSILFLDLDVVITDNIDNLFTFMGVNDFFRPDSSFNSSVFRFRPGVYDFIPERFKSLERLQDGKYQDKKKIYAGDQNYITECIYPHQQHMNHVYPDDWVISYKRGGRQWAIQQHPEAKVVCFHGKPDPHELKDEWILKHWI